jgi:hypothetical protein
MNEIKLALKNLWKAIVKHLLSKTTLDEKVAENVDKINKTVKSIDEADNK